MLHLQSLTLIDTSKNNSEKYIFEFVIKFKVIILFWTIVKIDNWELFKIKIRFSFKNKETKLFYIYFKFSNILYLNNYF